MTLFKYLDDQIILFYFICIDFSAEKVCNASSTPVTPSAIVPVSMCACQFQNFNTSDHNYIIQCLFSSICMQACKTCSSTLNFEGVEIKSELLPTLQIANRNVHQRPCSSMCTCFETTIISLLNDTIYFLCKFCNLVIFTFQIKKENPSLNSRKIGLDLVTVTLSTAVLGFGNSYQIMKVNHN